MTDSDDTRISTPDDGFTDYDEVSSEDAQDWIDVRVPDGFDPEAVRHGAEH